MTEKKFRFTRRKAIGAASTAAFVGGLAYLTRAPAFAKDFPIQRSRDEWRRRLTSAEFRILRNEGTELPYSSPLNEEERKGTYLCAGCNNEVFSSAHKYESGTGWPSFYRPIRSGVGTKPDRKLVFERTEVHCSDCGGHLGHVFDDGPEPTGKRWCMNGVAMDFRPA